MKLFNFRVDEEKLEKIKEKARKENRSVSNFLQSRALEETPNLALGDWWTDTTKLRAIIRAVKKQKKK